MLKSTCLLLMLLAAGASARRPKYNELTGYTFRQYIADFGKHYAPEELAMREKLFHQELKKVQELNADATRSWKAGINHLSDLSPEERARRNGGKLTKMWNHREKLVQKPHVKPHVLKSNAVLPREVDYRRASPPILTAVKDQGMCGSCWAHGSTENIESYNAMLSGQLSDLSQQQITSCAPNPNDCGGTGGCGGSIVELAYDYVIGAGGITEEWQYPYLSWGGNTTTCVASGYSTFAKLTGYVAVQSNDQKAVMDALATQGPLAINVDASSWGSYESGIFTGCDYAMNISIDHVVQLVGYGHDYDLGMDYWIVRNSWSPGWGEMGFIRLQRTETPKCGWCVDPQDGTGCNGGPPQLWTCGICGLLFDTLYPIVTAV